MCIRDSIKPAWLQETDLSTAKQTVVEFMFSTREWLRHALDAANAQATQEKSKAKVWHDRRARFRTFKPGDSPSPTACVRETIAC